ncbi:MAG: DUF4097 family beta strand repeat protein [Candidatus Eisenbacteria bacterium]|nr:DUF4097 family beta strand repeat protein [Candidatus Eisenbacteria bacterium]
MNPIGILCALALAAVVAAPASADEWNRSFPASGHPSVHVETNDGRVSVMTWDRPEVGFRVTTSGWHLRSQVQVEAANEGGVIALTAKAPPFSLSFGLAFVNHWLHIEVFMPRSADLDVRTGDGNVTIEPIEGHVRASTGDGSIVAHGIRGTIDLHSGDGGIDATELDGDLVASSGDGRVTVRGRFDRLDLSSGDGGVTAEALAGSALRDRWRIHTGDGHVTLRVPGDLKASLDARTGDGSIHVGVPVLVEGNWRPSEHEVRGTINGGGPPLELHTADGSIVIERI